MAYILAMRLPAVFTLLTLLLTNVFGLEREVVKFTFEHTVQSSSNAVYILGNHPDLGSNDHVQAIKLARSTGNTWQASIALEAGAEIEYKYIEKSVFRQSSYCATSSYEDISDLLIIDVPGNPISTEKSIYFISEWEQAFVRYSQNGVWSDLPLSKIESNQSTGNLFHIESVDTGLNEIEFYFHDNNGNEEHPDSGAIGDTYFTTPLKSFVVSNGHILNYLPNSLLSPSRVITHQYIPTGGTVPNRNVHVYIPRGFEQNTWKRYPVIYVADGNNVLRDNGREMHTTADRMIGLGQIPEIVIVGIQSPSRNEEYFPPSDRSSFAGAGASTGDLYLNFLLTDLLPWAHSNYRTTIDPELTVADGFSYGGLSATYLSWHRPDIFGGLSSRSGSYWDTPNYNEIIRTSPKRSKRIFMDTGTVADNWKENWEVYDHFVNKGYVLNTELKMEIGCGHSHQVQFIKQRDPIALRFLFPIQDGFDPLIVPNLANQIYPSSSIDLAKELGAAFSYQVVSGPAEIFNQSDLELQGPGKITLRVTKNGNENQPPQSTELALYARLENPLGDNDNDGTNNFVESALGSPIDEPSSGDIQTASHTGSLATYEFEKARNDIIYTIEVSSDLQSWSSSGITQEPSTIDSQKTIAAFSTEEAAFFRLKLQHESEL